MIKFLKGIITKSDKDQMSLTEILSTDKQKEEKDTSSKKQTWFHPNTNRNLAESKLKEAGLQTGMYLVRPSVFGGNFVLSLVVNKFAHHYHIRQRGTGCYYITDQTLFRGVDELVNFYKGSSAGASGLPSELKIACEGTSPPTECLAIGYTNILHHYIIEKVHATVLEILAHEACPNINAKNKEGNTALHEACVWGHEQVVQQLLEKGANASIQQLDGYTPLMLCCIHNKPSLIKLLIEVGNTDPQEQHHPSNNVALHEAARKGHLDCVKMLLSLKTAAPWPRNVDKMTPYALAETEGHKEIMKYIDKFTAPPADTKQPEWYHGELAKVEAETIIRKHQCKDGLFLVRKSSRKNLYILVLSSEQRIYNFEIKNEKGLAYYIDQSPLFSSLEHVIEYYSIREDGLPTRLVFGINPKDGHEVLMNSAAEDMDQTQAGAASNFRGSSRCHRAPAPPPSISMRTKRPPEPIKLNIKDIDIGIEIGEGEYGAVYRGKWMSHENKQVMVAIKTLHVRHASARADFLKEAQVMVQLDHQCIVQLIGVCMDEDKTYLVQELVLLGSMLDYMLDYPENVHVNPDLYLWATQVASGMSYLEAKNFIHRDLASRNILLYSKNQAKVGDFGLSRATGQNNDDYQASVGGRWPIKWYAPECVNFGTFSSRSDVWSYGVTLWEMFTLGQQPYGEKTGAQVIMMLEHGRRLRQPENCNDDVYARMKACWEYEPVKRPSFKDLETFFNNTYSVNTGIKLHNDEFSANKSSAA